ncbi:hypothetical protein VQ056_14075 [Paenibacillus sp. JTLBN-2024]
MDIGAGSGGIEPPNSPLADRNVIRIRMTLVDMTDEACREASRIFTDEPRVRAIRRNVFDVDESAADMLICLAISAPLSGRAAGGSDGTYAEIREGSASSSATFTAIGWPGPRFGWQPASFPKTVISAMTGRFPSRKDFKPRIGTG